MSRKKFVVIQKKYMYIAMIAMAMQLTFILIGSNHYSKCKSNGYHEAYSEFENIIRTRCIQNFDKDTIYRVVMKDTVVFHLSRNGIEEIK